jgi:hypothetical protein
MKKDTTTNRFRLIISLIVMFFISGCGEYFDNPLIDKETGEEISVLIIDFNFFKTSMSYKLLDASDGSLITKSAKITFAGQNSDDIVTFAGEKRGEFNIAEGQLELTIDPNISISENTPFEFAVNVDIDGYNHLAKGIQIQNEGKKTYELYLSKIADEEESDLTGNVDDSGDETVFNFSDTSTGTKSATCIEKPFSINYSLKISDLLKFKDAAGNLLFNSEQEVNDAYKANPDDFIKLLVSKYSGYRPGIELVNIDGTVQSVLFQKLETGRLKRLIIGGKIVAGFNGGVISATCEFTGNSEPEIFGFTNFENSSWSMLAEKIIHNNLQFSYTLAQVIEDSVCKNGGEISFNSNYKSSFSIDADVYDKNKNFLFTMTFKGKFPETFVMENVPDIPVTLVFRNNNPAFEHIQPIEVESLCRGNYNVDVNIKSNYVEYQIVLRAMCADNPSVGIAPTYNAEVRLKGSKDAWQGISMVGGKTDILGIPDREYQIRLLWDGKWEYSTYFTEFDKDGKYTHQVEQGAKIESKVLDDGRVQINIEKIFSQGICDDMGW